MKFYKLIFLRITDVIFPNTKDKNQEVVVYDLINVYLMIFILFYVRKQNSEET